MSVRLCSVAAMALVVILGLGQLSLVAGSSAHTPPKQKPKHHGKGHHHQHHQYDRNFRFMQCDSSPTVAKAIVDMIPSIPKGGQIVDLGSGSGEVLLQFADAHKDTLDSAVGYEILENLTAISRERAKTQNLENIVTVRTEDLWKADLSKADVVVFWGIPQLMNLMEQKFFTDVKEGAYIVTVDYPLPRFRLAAQKFSVDHTREECPEMRGNPSVALFMYQIPLHKDPAAHRSNLLEAGDPSLTIQASSFGEENHTAVYREMVCPKDPRSACVDAIFVFYNNVISQVSLNLVSYMQLEGHRIQVDLEYRGSSSVADPNAAAGSVEGQHGVEVINEIIQHQHLYKHGPHLLYYTYNLSTPKTLLHGNPMTFTIKLHPSETANRNLHLTYYYNLERLDQIKDGSYDLVAVPRSLGVFFTIWLQGSKLSCWARRHGRVYQLHLEIMHNGERVISELINPPVPTASVGFMHGYDKLTRDPSETIGLKAILIEKARRYLYKYNLGSWNKTVMAALDTEYSGNPTAALRTFEALSSTATRFEHGKELTTEEANANHPSVTVRFYSRLHSPQVVGMSILSDTPMNGVVMASFYVPGYHQQYIALECHASWEAPESLANIPPPTSSKATQVMSVCEFNHALPKYPPGLDILEVDLWFDADVVPANPATTKEQVEAATSAAGKLNTYAAWLDNAAASFTGVQKSKTVDPAAPGVIAASTLKEGDPVFSIPTHLVIRPHCILCRADWYQNLFDAAKHRAPTVHYALEMAKLALYTMSPRKVPFNIDEFAPFIANINKVRSFPEFQNPDLPMERETEPTAEELAQMGLEDATVTKIGRLQREAILSLYDQLRNHEHGASWFTRQFATGQSFVHFVAQTAAMVFPELNAMPILYQLRQSNTPNAKFQTDSGNVTVLAAGEIKPGDEITLGCNALYHLVWLFKGKKLATELGRDYTSGNHPGACQNSVVLDNGVILSRSEQSHQLVVSYYGNRLSATNDLRKLVDVYPAKSEERDIINFNLKKLALEEN